MKRYRLVLPKKLAFGDLFRQRLKKCLRPGAQTPRPPGKAARYDFILEGLRVLQTSPHGFLDSLRRRESEKIPSRAAFDFFIFHAGR